MARSLRTRTSIGLAGAVLAGGAITVSTLVTDTATAPRAAASGLPSYANCKELLSDLQKRAANEVGPYGWSYNGPGPAFEMHPGATTTDGKATTPNAMQPNAMQPGNPTGTNNQEVGVDEADTAKTNGKVLARVTGNNLEVYNVTGAKPRLLSSTALPKGMTEVELLLVGSGKNLNIVAIGATGAATTVSTNDTAGMTDSMLPVYKPLKTRLLTYSLSDPSAPKASADQTITGTLVSVRQYGDTVRLITNTNRPALPFQRPAKGRTQTETMEANRASVNKTKIEDWLPQVRDNVTGATKPLVDCNQVRHPKDYSGLDQLAVTSIEPGTDERSSVAVVTGGQVAYSSGEKLYVVSSRMQNAPLGGLPKNARVAPETEPATTIHEFSLNKLETSYQASTTVNATIDDRWSLDEHDGVLRAVVSWPGKNGSTAKSGILTFRAEGDQLKQIGSVDSLGPKAEVESVRFSDDLAVVSFRQSDPLYTVDLSDPAKPRALGELKIPGFSSYVHPITDGRLLGLGSASTAKGGDQGAQASTFNVSDAASPKQGEVLKFGPKTAFVAASEPRAFAWMPELNAAVTTVDNWTNGKGRVVRIDVAEDGSLKTETLASGVHYQSRTLPVSSSRIAIVDRDVKLVDLKK